MKFQRTVCKIFVKVVRNSSVSLFLKNTVLNKTDIFNKCKQIPRNTYYCQENATTIVNNNIYSTTVDTNTHNLNNIVMISQYDRNLHG